MDKYEYNLKLDEINRLVENENYEDAAEIADTVDWKRVRNARTLCMISEIYEATGRLEDGRAVLMRAYRRSQAGRMILARLTEISIRMKNYDEAIEYYSEFVDVAPNDNTRFLLKYQIYKGRGSALQEQIEILEEYKEREYTEKWAYELANLYYKAGEDQKCIEECDDLVLWFRQGKYVIKALELKKRLVPLSSDQQVIYDHRHEQVPNKVDRVAAAMPELEKVITEKMPTSEEEAITDSIISATERELAQAVSQHTAEVQAEKEQQEQQDDSWRYQAGPQIDTSLFDTKIIGPKHPEDLPEPADEFDMEALQKELASSLHEIVSGIRRKESDEDIIEPMNDKPVRQENVQEEQTEQEETAEDELPPINIDDVLTAMAAKAAEEKQEPSLIEEVMAEAEEAAAAREQEEEVQAASEPEIPVQEEVPAQEEAEDELPPINIDDVLTVMADKKAREQAAREEEGATEQEKEEVPEDESEEAPAEEVPEEEKMPVEKVTMDTIDLAAALERAAGVENMYPDPEPSHEESQPKAVQEQIPELTQDERYILSYFSSIQGLQEQIAMALFDAKKKLKLDRTSKSGNIVITGLPGSGRTTLAIRIAKALSRFKGEESARIARIYAEDFNRKDIPSTIAKIAGGTLIIEEAGDLDDKVADQLAKAMEFRTEGMILILEDEKHLLKALFERHPQFAEKFTSEVAIPIFTNDELVAFGKTYAFDEDYKIDDMATVTLYDRIGERQAPEHPVTIMDVKDIVDQAIKHSERIGVRKLSMILSKKRYDEDDRIILYDKDFK